MSVLSILIVALVCGLCLIMLHAIGSPRRPVTEEVISRRTAVQCVVFVLVLFYAGVFVGMDMAGV